jgi:hypothetical protein
MSTTPNPVLKMLKADHKKVQDLFAEYQKPRLGNNRTLPRLLLFRSWKSMP